MKAVWCTLVLLVTLGITPAAQAATITVNTTADELDSNSTCSLREAVQAANTNKKVGACAAGSSSGTDTINLRAGTYKLLRIGDEENANATGDLDLTGKVTLVGAGAGTVIDGNRTDRVLDVQRGASVTVKRLTLQNGWVETTNVATENGGAIETSGTLSLDSVTIQHSYAFEEGGGIHVATGGVLTAKQITLQHNRASGYGGGLANDGRATLTKSTVQQNTTEHGAGGILNEGAVTTQESTIRNNLGADGGGGGVSVFQTGTTTISDTLVQGNRSGWDAETYAGGIDSNGAPIKVQRSTITENQGGTGGITGNITITKTTVTGNTVTDEAGGPDCYGPITAQGRNEIGDTTNCQIQKR